jgi:peptide/nickel transport system substrate-binding protein
MPSKIPSLKMLSALSAALVAASCTTPSASTVPGPTDTVSTKATTTSDTLVIGSVEEPDTLNPHKAALFTSFKIAYGILEPLVNVDKDLTAVPGLAESWESSPDGKAYTFRLRKGVKWHDGRPFTSSDVVATWKLVMNPDFGAFFTLGFDKITAIETPDDYTAVIKLSEVYAPFLIVVGNALIVPAHLTANLEAFKGDFGRKPVGTGPFRFVQWDSARQIVLERNADYAHGVPGIARIIYKFVPDTNTLITQLRTGEVHMADSLGAADYANIKDLPNSDVRLLTGLTYHHIDLKNIGALMDKRVRQALDFATPKQQIVDQLLKGLGQVAVADQSPVTPTYNPTIQPRPYDLEKAADLLRQAGFVKGSDGMLTKSGEALQIDYWTPAGDQTAKQVGDAIAASWQKLGIAVTRREAAMQSYYGPDSVFFNKTVSAAQSPWTILPDPDTMFWWHSTSIPKEPAGSGLNLNAYFHPLERQDVFDQITEAGARELDPQRRKMVYWQLQELLHEEVPVIFLYWEKRIFVAPKELRYETNAGMPLLFNVASWAFESTR